MTGQTIANSVMVIKAMLQARGIDHSGIIVEEVVNSLTTSKNRIINILDKSFEAVQREGEVEAEGEAEAPAEPKPVTSRPSDARIIYSLGERFDRPSFKPEYTKFTYVILIIYRPLKGDTLNPMMPLTAKDVREIERHPQAQLFDLRELQFNIMKHSLVPPHQKISKKEGLELLEKYKVTRNQLPLILRKDPVAKFLGLKRGDIVKITRASETAGEYINYRYCT